MIEQDALKGLEPIIARFYEDLSKQGVEDPAKIAMVLSSMTNTQVINAMKEHASASDDEVEKIRQDAVNDFTETQYAASLVDVLIGYSTKTSLSIATLLKLVTMVQNIKTDDKIDAMGLLSEREDLHE
ncbi:hypothetical protein ACK8P5_26000 (plasmid) [Paenibacillus sp. EC2-1]|uniref:hypothetical protein n=1 Tax=Paenibacillus sp. EC2-1 TaxID=3388665 RepID=UPI003BEEF02D